jgi:hypothetical protein
MGRQAQGSVLVLHAANLDGQNPFDATSRTDATGYETFPNFAVVQPPNMDGGDGIAYAVNAVSPRSAYIVATIDVGTKVGPQAVTFENGPIGDSTELESGSGYSIAAATPTNFAAHAPAMGRYEHPYDSALYAFDTPAGLNVVDVAVTATGTAAADADPLVIRLPGTGRFADVLEIAAKSLYTTAGAAHSGYLIVWDDSGSAGYRYVLSATVSGAVGVMQSQMLPTSTAAAQEIAVGTVPTIILGATIDSETDARYFSLTLAQQDVGKSLRVFTEAGPGGDAGTDVAINVIDASAISILPSGTVDDGIFENVLTDPLMSAGRFYVVITAGKGFEAGDTHFQAMIRLE